MIHRSCLFLALVILALPTLGQEPSDAAAAPPRLILVSWDGAGDVWVDRLLAEGRLPHLHRLIDGGTRASHLVGTSPSKTAPSHASIYTGCGPAVHGVTANRVVYADHEGDHTVLEGFDGFSAEALHAEPLFVTAAKAGRRVAILSATHYEPHATLVERFGPLGDAGFLSFSAFRGQIAPSTVIGPDDLDADGRFTHRLGATLVHGRLLDDPNDPTEGFDTVRLTVEGREAAGSTIELKPRGIARGDRERAAAWSPAIAIRDDQGRTSATFFRLFDLAADGSRLVLYQRRAAAQLGHFSATELADYEAVAPGGHDAAFSVYGRGGLGRPLAVGGDGTAEDRLVEIAAFDMDLRIAGTRATWNRWRPELLFHYTPVSDQFSHGWVGLLDPSTSRFDPALAEAMWPYYAAVFDQIDRWLGAMLDLTAADNAVLALVSDHGMAGVDRDLNVTRLLADAGLLTFDAAGAIDLATTRVVPTAGEFSVRLNTDAWQQGSVPAAERETTLHDATRALLDARDADGQPVVRQVVDPRDEPDWIDTGAVDTGHDTAYGADLYFDTAPAVYAKGRMPVDRGLVVPIATPWAPGVHGFSPHRRSMHAIFYLHGSGVRVGVETPPARQIDVAPTLAHLVGLPAPANACGRVLFEALDRPPVTP